MKSPMKNYVALLAVTLLAGCATANNPRDPIEPVNRAVYTFNDKLDRAVLKPVAQGYKAVLPEPVRDGVHCSEPGVDLPEVVEDPVEKCELGRGGGHS